MRLLLDTCTIIWLANGDRDLSKEAIRVCGDPGIKLHVSAVSPWEIALKSSRGKLLLRMEPGLWWKRVLEHHSLEELAITSQIAMAAAGLEPIHNDPFGRLLVATAIEHGLTILTPDHEISRYRSIGVLW